MKNITHEHTNNRGQTPYRVRLPGFAGRAEVGLGDAIKIAAFSFGLTPCDACARRAAALNALMVFSGRRGG